MGYGLFTQTWGEAGILLRYSGNVLDAVTPLSPLVLNPPSRTYCRFTAGIATLAKGNRLTGGTSSAVINVVGVVVTAGTLAGTDAEGILFYDLISGVLVDGENLNIGGAAQAIARSAQITLPPSWVYGAKCVLIVAETNTIRLDYTPGNPTNSTATGTVSYGVALPAGSSVPITGSKNLENLKLINDVAANNGVATLVVYYGGVE